MSWDALNELISFLETTYLEMKEGLSQSWEWLSQAYLGPGDYLLTLSMVWAPWLFLGTNAENYGVVYAAVLSAAVWLVAAVLVKAGYNMIRDFVEFVLYTIRNGAVAVSHRIRMLRLKIIAPIRMRFRTTASVYFEEFDIDELQFAILRAQGSQAPGHVITAVDIANEFGVRPLRAQQALDGLKKLHLVDVSFGESDGFPAYLLTRPGEIFLSTCGRDGATPKRLHPGT